MKQPQQTPRRQGENGTGVNIMLAEHEKQFLYEIEYIDETGYNKKSVYARNAQNAQIELNLIRNDVIIISLVNLDL